MSELIDRQAFIENERKLYCEDCDRRKGTKNGKPNVICYEIGEAPCRSCWLDDALTDLEDAPTITAPRWHRVEEPPKHACDCFVCWTTIHDAETGEVTGHGFWCEKGWYEDGLLGEVGFYCQSRGETHPVRVEPDYWMPIEPPKEDA